MRATRSLVVSAVVLGGGLLLAAPASAQAVCGYPFDCPPPVPETPITGTPGAPATGGSGGGGGTTTEIDNSPVSTTVSTTAGGAGGGDGGAASLPFTGGEVTLMALSGVAAVGGGVVLVAAGRKRAKA